MGWFGSNSKNTPDIKKWNPIKPGRNANIPQLEFVSDITQGITFEKSRVWFVSNVGGIGRSNMADDCSIKVIEIPPEYVLGEQGYIDRNYLYFIEEEEGFLVRIHKPSDPNDLLPILEKLTETEIIALCLHDDKYCEPIKRITSVKDWRRNWKEGRAKEREKALDYDSAIEIWEELGEIEEAARVRKLKARQGSVRIAQKVVHGDEVSKTEIKDSVVSKSNVGGGSSKMQELKELTEMKKEGLIDDNEFKQMKKEILGK